MSRSRTTSSVTLFTGALLGAVVLGFVALAAAATSTGCATQETTEAPDATLPPCKPGPFIFCTEVSQETPGCNTNDDPDPRLSKLPRTRYGVGCVVDYVGDRDEGGNCKLDAVCKCQIGDIPPRPAPDSGAPDEDAGDAGDAEAEAAAPEPEPEPVDAGPGVGPVWNCYP